jgi:hypothetical protein
MQYMEYTIPSGSEVDDNDTPIDLGQKILKKKTLSDLSKEKPDMAEAIQVALKVHMGCFLIFTNRSKLTDKVLDEPDNQK